MVFRLLCTLQIRLGSLAGPKIAAPVCCPGMVPLCRSVYPENTETEGLVKPWRNRGFVTLNYC